MKLSVLLIAVAFVGASDAFQFFSKFKRAPKVDIDAEKRVEDMFGDKKLVVLTGASDGPGLEAASSLIASGKYHVVAPTHNLPRLQSIMAERNLPKDSFTPMQCDLASFDSVRSFCDEVEEWRGAKKIDRLVCNAAVCEPDLPEPKWTVDGHERTMQVNYLSHFLMISKLMEGMKEGTDPRVLTVGSVTGPDNSVAADGVYPIADLMDLDGFEAGFKSPICMADGYGFSAAKAYEDSKLCCLMLAAVLHARNHKLNGISFGSVYPGCLTEPHMFRNGADKELYDRYMDVITGGEGFVSEEVAGQHLFQAVDDAKCAKSGVYWSWRGDKDESKYVGSGDADSIYEGSSIAFQNIELARDLYDVTTDVTEADWPKIKTVVSPCPTLKVIGAISKASIEKEELKRMREMPGFDTGEVPVSRRKKIVAKVDKVVGTVLGKTVGRVIRPVLGFLNRRVLGKLPEEAVSGSLQEEKPLEEEIGEIISKQLEVETKIGKTDEELISEVMTGSSTGNEGVNGKKIEPKIVS
mmetsp:Transcript_23868/g.51660  ORF Transcript_23868/g.51660 Transcript_23868/m.51660 type:complete len:523 (-) Transcript_23868:37-1605(-)